MAELGMGLSGADLIISQSSSLRIIPILNLDILVRLLVRLLMKQLNLCFHFYS